MKNNNLKVYSLLSMLYLTFILSADVLFYKIIQLGSIVMTVGSFITPFWFVITDIVAEVYGYNLARKLVWSGLLCSFIFTFICASLIKLPSPLSWHYQIYYDHILGSLPRIYLGSVVGFFTGSFVNAYLIVKWKALTRGKYFAFRSIGSSGIGQLAFTIVTIFIDLIHVVPVSQILEIITVSFSIKIMITPILAFPSSLITLYIKKLEGIDVYDHNISYNPFKVISD